VLPATRQLIPFPSPLDSFDVSMLDLGALILRTHPNKIAGYAYVKPLN